MNVHWRQEIRNVNETSEIEIHRLYSERLKKYFLCTLAMDMMRVDRAVLSKCTFCLHICLSGWLGNEGWAVWNCMAKQCLSTKSMKMYGRVVLGVTTSCGSMTRSMPYGKAMCEFPQTQFHTKLSCTTVMSKKIIWASQLLSICDVWCQQYLQAEFRLYVWNLTVPV